MPINLPHEDASVKQAIAAFGDMTAWYQAAHRQFKFEEYLSSGYQPDAKTKCQGFCRVVEALHREYAYRLETGDLDSALIVRFTIGKIILPILREHLDEIKEQENAS